MSLDGRRFLGENLALIRDLHALSREELAAQLSVTPQFIGALERQVKAPSAVLVKAASEVLGVSEEYFYTAPADLFRDEECAFRRRKSTPLRVRRRALAHGTLLGQLAAYIDEHLDLPPQNVPSASVSEAGSIERVAETCRMRWGLGVDTPILNAVRVLEHAGVVVSVFELGEKRIDAFSRPGRRDVVALSHDKRAGSRCRFDAAHELGHLLLHRGEPTGTPETEAEADSFASAFLLPRAGFAREFPKDSWLPWDVLFRMKRRWKVSLAAIVRRAFDLKIIDAVNYQRAYKRMSYHGWRTGEPDDFEPEQPELVPIALRELERAGRPPHRVAADLGWSDAILAQIARVPVEPRTDDSTTSRPGVVRSLRAG